MKTRLARALSVASYLALIAWVMLWIVFVGEVERRHISPLLLMFVTPLLLPLRGVLAGRDKAMIWGALVSLAYAVHGGVVLWSGSGAGRWPGGVEAGLSLVYLFSASLFVRWRAMQTAAA